MRVNEVYGPVQQGEGPALGENCLFLRLAGCNLRCTWCDTPYSHRWDLYDRASEEHEIPVDELAAQLRTLARKHMVGLVIASGGEPLLQSRALLDLMWQTKELTYDIETAGTIWPGEALIFRCRNVVVSPKLKMSGNEGRSPIRLDVLRQFAVQPKVAFKFVIEHQNDAEEAMELLHTIGRGSFYKVFFMPLGATREQLAKTSPIVQQLAKIYDVKYTPRRHIELYGSRRGI